VRYPFLLGLALWAVLPAWAQEQELPQWEAGAGFAALSIPDYRGSDKQNSYLLPLPYLIYRGETVKVDKEGAHADIFKSERAKLDVSFNVGPPAKSSENGARTGMPNIDPTVEGGPALKLLLAKSADRNQVLTLRFPWRAVIATDLSHFDYIGWIFAPHFNYDVFDLGGSSGWNLGLAIGPLYASEKYHDYYYEVAPQYATAARPAYDAKSGYSGTQLTAALSKRYPQFWVGVFVRYDDLSGTVFEDSPLVRKKESLMFGGGVSWVFAKSPKTVRVVPELLR
jgi:outer membrane scaffolding protein for murein synthesis (MipA/OmpV family)